MAQSVRQVLLVCTITMMMLMLLLMLRMNIAIQELQHHLTGYVIGLLDSAPGQLQCPLHPLVTH